MNRQQLEHIIRAAADIADDDDVVVIGSQSILAQYPSAPASLLQSMEADVFPRTYPERAAIIDGAIGELSMFHETFGYYAQGVAPETATLPQDWQSRLVAIKARSATGWCLDIHDLAIAKLVAGRAKDIEFLQNAAGAGLIDRRVVADRLTATTLADVIREAVTARIGVVFRP